MLRQRSVALQVSEGILGVTSVVNKQAAFQAFQAVSFPQLHTSDPASSTEPLIGTYSRFNGRCLTL